MHQAWGVRCYDIFYRLPITGRRSPDAGYRKPDTEYSCPTLAKLTQNPYFKKDFGFKDKIQRAAVSIPSNIAEGNASGTDNLSVRYFYIAKGSAAELMTQLIIASEIGYIDNPTREELINDCDKLSAMLARLIKSRQACGIRRAA